MGLFGKKNGNNRSRNVTSFNDDPYAALDALQEDAEYGDNAEEQVRLDVRRMLDQGTGSIVDLWAPPRMRIMRDWIEMGDECLSVLTVTNWPAEIEYGSIMGLFDSPELSDIKIDINLHIHPIRKEEAQTYVMDQYTSAAAAEEAEEERGSRFHDANRKAMSRKAQQASILAAELENPNENMFQVAMYIGVYGQQIWGRNENGEEYLERTAREDLIDKERRLRKALSRHSGGGFAVSPLLHQQREGLKSLMPWGSSSIAAFQNFYTSALATLYPFTQGTLQVTDGIYYGHNLQDQPIFFDNFSRQWVSSFNCIIIGDKGSGKSATVKTLLGRYAVRGSQIFIFDPAQQGLGEYTNFATSLDGSIIDFGGRDDWYVNPFELTPPETWRSGMPTDTNEAKVKYLSKKKSLLNLFSLMLEEYKAANDINDRTDEWNDTISTLLNRLYLWCGVSLPAAPGQSFDYENWRPECMPNMSKFYRLIDTYVTLISQMKERAQLAGWGKEHLDSRGQLKTRSERNLIAFGYYQYCMIGGHELWGAQRLATLKILRSVIAEYVSDASGEGMNAKAKLFEGRRPVDLHNQVTIFRFGNLHDAELDVAMFIAFDLINTRLNAEDPSNAQYKHKIICLEEAWALLSHPSARQFFEGIYRTARKLNTGVWLISQQFQDFQGEDDIFWKEAQVKLLMKMNGDDVNQLTPLLNLPLMCANLINGSAPGNHPPGWGVLSIQGTRQENVVFYCQMTPLEARVADSSNANKAPLTAAEILGPDLAEQYGLI